MHLNVQKVKIPLLWGEEIVKHSCIDCNTPRKSRKNFLQYTVGKEAEKQDFGFQISKVIKEETDNHLKRKITKHKIPLN